MVSKNKNFGIIERIFTLVTSTNEFVTETKLTVEDQQVPLNIAFKKQNKSSPSAITFTTKDILMEFHFHTKNRDKFFVFISEVLANIQVIYEQKLLWDVEE